MAPTSALAAIASSGSGCRRGMSMGLQECGDADCWAPWQDAVQWRLGSQYPAMLQLQHIGMRGTQHEFPLRSKGVVWYGLQAVPYVSLRACEGKGLSFVQDCGSPPQECGPRAVSHLPFLHIEQPLQATSQSQLCLDSLSFFALGVSCHFYVEFQFSFLDDPFKV